jgi:hypothetical protein
MIIGITLDIGTLVDGVVGRCRQSFTSNKKIIFSWQLYRKFVPLITFSTSSGEEWRVFSYKFGVFAIKAFLKKPI